MQATATRTFTLTAYINLQLFNSSTLQLVFNDGRNLKTSKPQNLKTVGHLRQDASGTLVSL